MTMPKGAFIRFTRRLLSEPWGIFLLNAAYAALGMSLLCPLDALDMLTEFCSPLFFTVPLMLIHYPLIFIITGAAAGKYPRKLWAVPLMTLALLFLTSNLYGSGVFALGYYGSDPWYYYIHNEVSTMLVYLALGYGSMLFAWLFFWKRPELYIPRMWAVLGTFAMGPLMYGAAHIPGYCWGHPFWGEALWYIMYPALAAVVGFLCGGNIKMYIAMPLAVMLVALSNLAPPTDHFGARIPGNMEASYSVICFFLCLLCMLLKFFRKPLK